LGEKNKNLVLIKRQFWWAIVTDWRTTFISGKRRFSYYLQFTRLL